MFDDLEQLYKGENYSLFRALRGDLKQQCLIKRPSDDDASTGWAQLSNEYDLCSSLELKGVLRPVAKETGETIPAIIFDDPGGTTLEQVIQNKPLSIDQFFPVAIELTEIIGRLHASEIIHKNIHSGNVVVSSDDGGPRVFLTGFGIASTFTEEALITSSQDRLQGTLAVISPEQTGRIARSVDYRTDFYSLGVVMYQMLAGSLPFDFQSSMEMVYAHLAKEPPDLIKVNPDIPRVISRLIMKLVSKDADDRYHSSEGLVADLKHCLDEYQKHRVIRDFELAKKDVVQSFIYPGKLFGRDEEYSRLDGIFQRICGGSVEMVLVKGGAGTGKTELVNRLRTSIGQKKGYFMKGKSDLMSRTPYFSFVQAISDGVGQLLMQPLEIVERVKQKWISTLGMNARVLTDGIPALKTVLGDLPAIPELPPEQTRNRFHLAVQKMLCSAISLRGRPIVIFLDDLQWADQQTLKLVEALCCDAEQRNLLIVGTYRNDEVDERHGLTTTKNTIISAGGVISEIELQPLDVQAVDMLLCHAFQPLDNTCDSLAEVCLNKTGGNPLYIRQFIAELVESGSIYFEPAKNCWCCHYDEVKDSQLAENVADYLAFKLKGFDTNALKILVSASCIGTVFDLDTLSYINNQSLQQCLDTLWPAISEQYIALLQSDRKCFAVSEIHGSRTAPQLLPEVNDGRDIRFTFVHDRLYEAAYNHLVQEERVNLHARIGRYWQTTRQQARFTGSLHDILGQLNRGIPSLKSYEEKKELALLNLQGGTAAQEKSHSETAFEYFKTGIDLLGEQGWKKEYVGTRELHSKGMQAAFLSGYYDELHWWFGVLKHEAATPLECVDGYIAVIHKEMTQHNLQKGVADGLEILGLLGVSFPDNANSEDFVAELDRTESMLSHFSSDQILALPKMTKEEDLAVMRVMFAMVSACYLTDRILHHLLVLQCVQLTLRKGSSAFSSMIFTTLGFILSIYPEKTDKIKWYGEIGLRFTEMFLDHNTNTRTSFLYHMGVGSLISHLRDSVEGLIRVQSRFVGLGNLVHTGNTLYIIEHLRFVQGVELEKQKKNIDRSLQELATIRHQAGTMLLLPLQQVLFNLSGRSEHTTELIGDAFDERTLNWEDLKNETFLVTVSQYKMILAYYFDHFEEAEKWFRKIELSGHAVNIPSLYTQTILFGSLASLALSERMSSEQVYTVLEKTGANQEILRRYADSAPMNFSHIHHMVRAERARVSGNHEVAEQSYEQALEDAAANGYLHDEALAYELAAKYWIERGRKVTGRMFMQQAMVRYTQWGASAKAQLLKEKYPFLAGESKDVAGLEADYVKHQTVGEDFDVMSALKASRAISGEVKLDRLLDTLMSVVIENAGATRGCFLLSRGDKLFLSAMADVDLSESFSHRTAAVELSESSEYLPLQVANYVCHTRETAVLNDARENDLFRFDPYIESKQPRAVLCTPLIRKEQLSGLLYLENNLLSGAFSEDKLQIVEILSAQIGVSLENAILYEQKLQAEAALHSEKERLAVTLRSIGEGVLTTDVLGKITSLNPTAEELTGWPQHRAKGKPLHDIFATFGGSGEPQWRDLVSHVLQTNSPTELPENAVLVTKSGTRKNIMASCAPIHDGGGKTIGSVLIFKDVTDKLHMEERMQQAQKMEAIGTLAGGIAHDFNNILSPVIGYSELLLERLGGDQQIRDSLLRINQAGTRGREVVKQILLLGRKHEKQMEPVRLQDIVKEVERLCSSIFPASIELLIDIHKGCPPVLADATQIHQVLLNLVTNASHAIATNIGQITIRLQEVSREKVGREVVTGNQEHVVMLSVEDTGCGMSSETRKRIFDPYFTTKDANKGTGLGLATTHTIVQEHNGYIEVESEVGKGTVFRVILPALHKNSEIFKQDNGGYKDLIGSARILFVDDEPEIAALGQSMLESLGYTVTILNESEKALGLFKKNPDSFDLVITDMTMPKMTGDILAQRISSLRPQIPIIACTGYSDRLNTLQGEKTPFVCSMKKPFSRDELGEAVKKSLKPDG